jgi:hypothetical protein
MKWSSVICVLGGAALVAVALAFGPYLPLSELSIASGGMLDEAPRSTAATVRTHFESIGPEGRGLYRSHFFFDLAFLTANALVLFGLLRLALARLPWPRSLGRTLLSVPWIFAALDLAENVAISRLLSSWQSPAGSWTAVASFTTQAKFASFSLAVLATLIALASWAWTAWRGSRRP